MSLELPVQVLQGRVAILDSHISLSRDIDDCSGSWQMITVILRALGFAKNNETAE